MLFWEGGGGRSRAREGLRPRSMADGALRRAVDGGRGFAVGGGHALGLCVLCRAHCSRAHWTRRDHC
eukprot:2015098-Prymnesium_polylepis.1